MTESITVVDDFLPRHLYSAVAQLISKTPLSYGSRSNFRTDPHGHWSHDFVDAGLHNLADVSGRLGSDEQLGALCAVWSFLHRSRMPESVLVRCYLNGYTYGTDGYFHNDSERPDEYTTILYVTDHWEPDWAGETVFLDPGGDIVKAVLPRRNRAVVFPAGMSHAGRSVSRKCLGLRSTLIFKARKRRSDDFERLSAFLQTTEAAERAHHTGTLHDHLVRTFSLLEARNLDPAVCFGAGLHSVYGTRSLGAGVLTRDAKSQIVSEFGSRAEELVDLFALVDRPRTLNAPLAVTDLSVTVQLRDGQTRDIDCDTFAALRLIECANLADQRGLSRFQTLSRLWEETPVHH